MTKYYHGDVKTDNLADSDKQAVSLALSVASQLRDMGGEIEVARNFGDAPAILVVALPDDVALPENLVEGVSFNAVNKTTFPAYEDKGIE